MLANLLIKLREYISYHNAVSSGKNRVYVGLYLTGCPITTRSAWWEEVEVVWVEAVADVGVLLKSTQ